ncbi:MAG: response regulator [Chloroflexi bacterium]|nr:response regulator [Chloroflexota bacterium]
MYPWQTSRLLSWKQTIHTKVLYYSESNVNNHINVVTDGVEAIHYLRQENQYAEAYCPDTILLDLNLPRKNGHEVFAEIKVDPDLKQIPVLT